MLMLPEIIVIVTAFGVLLADLFLDDRRRTALAPIAISGLVAMQPAQNSPGRSTSV